MKRRIRISLPSRFPGVGETRLHRQAKAWGVSIYGKRGRGQEQRVSVNGESAAFKGGVGAVGCSSVLATTANYRLEASGAIWRGVGTPDQRNWKRVKAE